jgi:hypothetical protein
MTGRPPRVIYIIPSGQNPTGAVMGVERKRDIYEVGRGTACAHMAACTWEARNFMRDSLNDDFRVVLFFGEKL